MGPLRAEVLATSAGQHRKPRRNSEQNNKTDFQSEWTKTTSDSLGMCASIFPGSAPRVPAFKGLHGQPAEENFRNQFKDLEARREYTGVASKAARRLAPTDSMLTERDSLREDCDIAIEDLTDGNGDIMI